MKAQLEKQDAEMGRQGMAIELQAVEIKQLKAQCEQLGSEWKVLNDRVSE